MTDAQSGTEETPRTALYAVQTESRQRWAATVVAVLVGVLVASVHWTGLIVGGALVGLSWPTFRQALVAGLAFGVVVLVVFAGRLALAGSLTAYLGMGQILAISVAVPLVAGLLGASTRGLIADAPDRERQ